jgi:hypothetical protein
MREFVDPAIFEAEVLRIAAQLWPSADVGGPTVEGRRERDGLFVTEDVVHLLECSLLRTKEKAEKDCDKLAELQQKMQKRYPDKAIKAWWITKEPPTGDQLDVVRDRNKRGARITNLPFRQFQAKLVDVSTYLDLRGQYPFGSARNPETDKTDSLEKYLEVGFFAASPSSPPLPSTQALVAALLAGARPHVLRGDYGMGKSMCMREVFTQLKDRYLLNESSAFPLLLNLRDHPGDTDPPLAIYRHARNIGFSQPDHLVRAWRAGYAIPMLDGFDEIASPGWSREKESVRKLRRHAVQLVRSFIRETPSNISLLISGRDHYFDSADEMQESLGLPGSAPQYTVSEFDAAHVKKYLAGRGWTHAIPPWLPTRPLLLGYLAARGFLQEIMSDEAERAPGIGWHRLIDRMCAREAEIVPELDGSTVREILARLATIARRSSDGVGPFTIDEISETFRICAGYAPDDRALVLIGRLPGLGARTADGTRSFIDADLVDVIRADDIARFVFDPHGSSLNDSLWLTQLGPLGQAALGRFIQSKKITPKQLDNIIDDALARGLQRVASDLVLAMARTGLKRFSNSETRIDGLMVEEMLVAPGTDLSGIILTNAMISELEIEPDVDGLPVFIDSQIDAIVGRASASDLPANFLSGRSSVGHYSEVTSTTRGIRNLALPLGARVMLTCLEKLFAQRGTGRQDSAMRRGLSPEERAIVAEVLDLLRREGIVEPYRHGTDFLWIPDSSSRPRVRALLAAPKTSADPLIEKAAQIAP